MDDYGSDTGLASRDPDDAPSLMARAVGAAIRRAVPEAFRESRREMQNERRPGEGEPARPLGQAPASEGAPPGMDDLLGAARNVSGAGASAGIPGMGAIDRMLARLQAVLRMIDAIKNLMAMWERYNAPSVKPVPEFRPIQPLDARVLHGTQLHPRPIRPRPPRYVRPHAPPGYVRRVQPQGIGSAPRPSGRSGQAGLPPPRPTPLLPGPPPMALPGPAPQPRALPPPPDPLASLPPDLEPLARKGMASKRLSKTHMDFWAENLGPDADLVGASPPPRPGLTGLARPKVAPGASAPISPERPDVLFGRPAPMGGGAADAKMDALIAVMGRMTAALEKMLNQQDQSKGDRGIPGSGQQGQKAPPAKPALPARAGMGSSPADVPAGMSGRDARREALLRAGGRLLGNVLASAGS